MTAGAEQNRNLVVGALQAATSGDIDTFLAALHPNISVHEPLYLPYGGRYEGREGFLRLMGEATKILDLAKVDLLSATADEERTVLLMKVPLISSGESVHVTEHWRVEDGLVTDIRVFWFELPDFG